MSTTRPLPTSLHAPLHAAYDGVVKDGKHLSAVFEDLFRALQPSAFMANQIRTALLQAVRYGDVQAAVHGALENVRNGRRLYCPPWLMERLTASLGNKLDAYLNGCVVEAPVTIRVNLLRTDVDTCVKALADHGARRVGNVAVEIDKPYGLFKSEAFSKGWFEQQDGTSQLVAASLKVEPGMRVIDSCAGAGGKSLQIAAQMQNRGRLIALDTVSEKLDACKRRASRAGVDVLETRLIDTTKVVKRMAGTADRVLIDAPCSGTGVVRRNPDIMWHLTEEKLTSMLETQAQILRLHAKMVKPGGRVVYAVCSVLREEGPEQVQAFVESNEEFSVVDEWSTLPGEQGGDGFYVATLTRSSAS